MFPYDGSVGLAHLEGFDATPHELTVVGNHGFLHCQRQGFPKLGELAMGGDEVTAPSAVGKCFDDVASLTRSLLVCAAKARRDILADPVAQADPRNQQLLADLRKWLNGQPPDADHFRWERYWTQLQQNASQRDWVAEAARQMEGISNVIVLLTGSLPSAVWKELADSVRNHVREIHSIPEDGVGSHLLTRYAPWPKCLHCEQKAQGGGHPDRCEAHHLLPVLDCGRNVKDVMAWLPRELQKQVSAVRFRLPRSTFVNMESNRQVLPRFLCFDLHTLRPDTQMRVFASINELIEKQKREFEKASHESYRLKWRDLEIISPTGNKPPSVVIAAGKNAHEARIYDVDDQLKQRGYNFYNLISRGMTVSLI
jgi:hypothetical protein